MLPIPNDRSFFNIASLGVFIAKLIDPAISART
jgi:hypothetical protein